MSGLLCCGRHACLWVGVGVFGIGSAAILAGCSSAGSTTSAPVAESPPAQAAPAAASAEGTATAPASTPAAFDSPARLPAERTSPPAAGNAAPPAAGSTLAAGNVALKVVDVAGYQTAVDGHKGKVVLVDFWATWCGPCKEEFPHSVALSRKWKDRGLAVISVSFDDPENQQNALDFLKQQDASFENLMSQHGASVESGVAFDIVGGALPYYKLYDRSGKLRYQFTGNIDGLEGVLKTEELDKRVEELLAEGA